MSLTADNVVQENTGMVSPASTSCPVSLGSGTAAGGTVLVVITAAALSGATLPSGFVADKTQTGATSIGVYRKSDVAAGETSWTFTLPTSSLASWYVCELSNVDTVEPLDVTVSGTGSLSNGGTISTGTTAVNAGLSTVALAVYGAFFAAGNVDSFSGYTNGFDEVVDFGTTTAPQLAVARKFVDATTGTFSSTATFATTNAGKTVAAIMVVYRAADVGVVAPLNFLTGFEFGTHGGFANTGVAGLQSPTGSAASGTWGTGYDVGASYARFGGYGLRISQSASIATVALGPDPAAGAGAYAGDVRVVSGSGTPTVQYVSAGTTTLQLVYDITNTRFGLRWGTGGTVSWQSGTTALNAYVFVDFRAKWNSGTYHAEWWLEVGGVVTAQTSPADLTGQTPITNTGARFAGFNASQTMVAHYDNQVSSRYYVAGPLGRHYVSLVVPDTTGASVSGTAANFQEFTANGTLAAFAATSGQRIDEVPPDVSVSSDGVVQVTLAASDYMQFPMGTVTAAADEMIGGVRMVAALWGGTGSGTGTLGFRGYDGTTETVLVAAGTSYDAASPTALSSVDPGWMGAMWQQPGGWSQAKLDAAALRVGFSTDATPDMGISALYLEVAVKKAAIVRQVAIDDPISASVDLYMNTDSSASVSYLVTNNDAVASVNFNYSVSGTPQTPVTVGPSASQAVTVTAAAFGDISDVSITPV